jgi:hypothetical protein
MMEQAQSHRVGRVLRLQACWLTTGMLACEATSAPEEVVYEHTATPEMVTGAALAALRPDGRFNLVRPVTTAEQVSVDLARSQALRFARYVTNQLLLRGVVEAERRRILDRSPFAHALRRSPLRALSTR